MLLAQRLLLNMLARSCGVDTSFPTLHKLATSGLSAQPDPVARDAMIRLNLTHLHWWCPELSKLPKDQMGPLGGPAARLMREHFATFLKWPLKDWQAAEAEPYVFAGDVRLG
ncbi:MAG: hypothetical protein HY319_00110 [Armatimonadetes bacterium]|nr:hypothetical protein [Armatimonadota bacterium]